MPYKIIKKKQLGSSGTLFEMDLYAPLIAKKAHAGNFILIRINAKGERFPLTIADYNREMGIITIVVQIVGKSTLLLSHQNEGDELLEESDYTGVVKASNLSLGEHTYQMTIDKVLVGLVYKFTTALHESDEYSVLFFGDTTSEAGSAFQSIIEREKNHFRTLS